MIDRKHHNNAELTSVQLTPIIVPLILNKDKHMYCFVDYRYSWMKTSFKLLKLKGISKKILLCRGMLVLCPFYVISFKRLLGKEFPALRSQFITRFVAVSP